MCIRDRHSLLARVLFPEIAHLSDEEIMTKHKDKRTASKAPRFAMSYGGNAYTLHVNEGIPMKRATEIEIGFKDLHEGLYEWGNMMFIEAVSVGYIESVDGWRLRLPRYGTYLKMEEEVKSMSREDWTDYSNGKKEYKKEKEANEAEEPYIVKDEYALKYYKSKVRSISNFFKLKSEYQRLCLNSPVQTAGAHQLKLAISLMFEWIVEEDLLWDVKICNSVHDEIILETLESLAEKSKDKLEECMIEGGNHYLEELTIKADAHIGMSWYEAK